MDYLENAPIDPWNSDAVDYIHVQTVGYSGTYDDLIAPAAANYPPSAPDRYFLFTNWVIDISDLAGDRPFLIKDVTTSTALSPTSSDPGTNEYKLPPSTSDGRNRIELNATQAGHIIAIDCYKEKDTLNAEVFNLNSIYITSAGVSSRVRTTLIKIEIGDWNMDVDANKTITHSLDITKIGNISVLIRNDADTIRYDLSRPDVTGATVSGGVLYIYPTTIELWRVNSGVFDANTFDSTFYNRGWITIIYEG